MLVLPGPRTRLLGPVLAIEAVTLEDSGVYRCSASNPGGEASAEVRLEVYLQYIDLLTISYIRIICLFDVDIYIHHTLMCCLLHFVRV